MKRQGIYWLVKSPSEHHTIRAALLEELQFSVTFFTSLEELQKELLVKRVSIILVGDELDLEESKEAINYLATMPDIQGARLLLSLSKPSPEICFFAACSGFRDIIPLSLEPSEWVFRFQFSTASNNESGSILGKKKFKKLSKIRVGIPTRIGWIRGDKIWIESKVRPSIGDMLGLRGPLAEEMGSTHLKLRVESQEHRNLIYRFSEAAICSWETEKVDTEKVDIVFDELKRNNQGVKKKVFLAMQSPALRNAIMKYLNPEIFDVHSALQKKSLISEPKYFTPTLVFIEFRLCQGEGMSRFQEMVAQIPEKSTVVLVGAKAEELSRFHNFALGRRIEALFQIPKNLPEIIQSNYLKSHDDIQEQNIYISRRHRYTLAEMELESTLQKVEGDLFEIDIPVGLANYGLVRLTLEDGTELFAKVVSTSTPKHRDDHIAMSYHTITCRISWVNQDHQDEIADYVKKKNG